jgi:hypothetical protein
MPGAGISSDHNLQVVKICTIVKKIIKLQKDSQVGVWRSYMPNNKLQNTLEGKLGAIECESRNVEVQCNSIKKCVLDTENRQESKKAIDYTAYDQ